MELKDHENVNLVLTFVKLNSKLAVSPSWSLTGFSSSDSSETPIRRILPPSWGIDGSTLTVYSDFSFRILKKMCKSFWHYFEAQSTDNQILCANNRWFENKILSQILLTLKIETPLYSTYISLLQNYKKVFLQVCQFLNA